MRLVYLNADPGVPLLGTKGASVHVRALVKALAGRVAKLTVVTARRDPRSGIPVTAEIPAETIEAGVDGGPGERELHAFAVNDRLGTILDGLRARGDLDAIYERHSLAGVAGAEASRRWGVPRVVEMNAPLVDEATRHRSLRLRSLSAFVECRLLAEADRVVAVSEELRAHATGLGVDPARLVVIPNGFDASLFPPPRTRAAAAEAEARPFTVAFVGSLKPWHGLEGLVAAFTRLHMAHPGARLLVVGDGPLASEVRRQLESAVPSTAFEMTGAVAHDRIPDLLRGVDAAVAPYPGIEPFYFSPLKILEYCAAGLPVVASAVGQIRELLVDGESALLVPPGDVDALTGALGRLATDGALRARLGLAAREVVRGRSWDDISERVIDLLHGARFDPVPARAGVRR